MNKTNIVRVICQSIFLQLWLLTVNVVELQKIEDEKNNTFFSPKIFLMYLHKADHLSHFRDLHTCDMFCHSVPSSLEIFFVPTKPYFFKKQKYIPRPYRLHTQTHPPKLRTAHVTEVQPGSL